MKTKQSNCRQQVLGTKEFFSDDLRELEKNATTCKNPSPDLENPIPPFQQTDYDTDSVDVVCL